jgi:nucleoside-diphosphate-sugar epimerase
MSATAYPQGTIAVTGALGFVASRLLPRLTAGGARVLAVVRPGRDAAELASSAHIEVRRGALDQPASLAAAFTGADRVVHLAGLALVPGMLPALAEAGVRGGVFVSSAGVRTQLVSTGADRKRAGEAALRASALSYTILRPSMIYGTPRDRNMIRLLRLLERWPLVPSPLGGVTLQQPVHVDDLVSAILAALVRPEASRAEYDVGGPEPIALRDVIGTCARALGRPYAILPLPLGPAHALATLARRLHLPFPVRPEQVLRLTESKAVDITPARRDLGFAPRPFPEGIEAEVAMLRARA